MFRIVTLSPTISSVPELSRAKRSEPFPSKTRSVRYSLFCAPAKEKKRSVPSVPVIVRTTPAVADFSVSVAFCENTSGAEFAPSA